MLSEEAKARYKQRLSAFVPHDAVDELFDFMERYAVQLRVSRQRASKYGDYRCPTAARKQHAISVNGDLNPYFFLTVLLHEMAHLLTFEQCGRRAKPHGEEWQRHYAMLLRHYAAVFPEAVRPSLLAFAGRLPLSPSKERMFERQLRALDAGGGRQTVLDDLPAGTCFRLKGKVFRAEEKRRTRWRCVELTTGTPYLVSGDAPVEIVAAE